MKIRAPLPTMPSRKTKPEYQNNASANDPTLLFQTSMSTHTMNLIQDIIEQNGEQNKKLEAARSFFIRYFDSNRRCF